jgi:hypothetical protein
LVFHDPTNVYWAFNGGSPALQGEVEFAPRAVSVSANPYASPNLTFEPPTVSSGAESVVEAFVPSKNGPALASYYLGLFSLFPFLGLLLVVPAVFYGLRGLRQVRANPQVRGGAHAWVGLVCGSLFGLFNLALLALLVIGLVIAPKSR